jgi:hypothetical protein
VEVPVVEVREMMIQLSPVARGSAGCQSLMNDGMFVLRD